MYPLLDNELYWLHVLALFVVSFFVGDIIANYLYRDVSWSSLIMSDNWNYRGMRWTGLEMYLFIIFIISLIVVSVLDFCVCFFFQK